MLYFCFFFFFNGIFILVYGCVKNVQKDLNLNMFNDLLINGLFKITDKNRVTKVKIIFSFLFYFCAQNENIIANK